jgi:hypothetical protein
VLYWTLDEEAKEKIKRKFKNPTFGSAKVGAPALSPKRSVEI